MCKHLYKMLLLLAVVFAVGCNDMKLQTDADYESSVIDPHVNMTAWEYMQTRQDIFSDFIKAVEFAQMTDFYTQTETEYTYLALTNVAIQEFVSNFGVASIEECPQEEVKHLIEYHIVKGFYSGYGQLPVEPIFVLTLREGEQGLMTMLTRKNPWMADAGKIIVNDTGSNGNSPMRRAASCNIMPTNGVIHVFDSYCYYKR